MLTVIIVPKEYLETINKHKLFLYDLSNNKNIVLCQCDYSGNSIEEMVPELNKVIANCDNWRAIIITPDNRNVINPYDYTRYTEQQHSSRTLDWSYYSKKRYERFACYEKATGNPLVALTSALCKPDYSKINISDEDYKKIISGELPVYKYMLRKRLETLNVAKFIYRSEVIKDEQLLRLVGEADYSNLLESLRENNLDEIIKLIGIDRVLDLNKILGGADPQYVDPEFIEEQLFNYKKKLLLAPIENRFTLYDNHPNEVICVSLRTYDIETYHNGFKPKSLENYTYSKFVEFNMYPRQLQYFTYDIISEKDKRYQRELIKFLTFILVFAANKIPHGVVENNFLYRIVVDYDNGKFNNLCKNYVDKLYSTVVEINRAIYEQSHEQNSEIDDNTAEELFESHKNIPVELRPSRNSDNLYAKYNIGLSKDCPTDEEMKWDNQYNNIKKSFTKYIREPRRAVKTAVKGDFRIDNKVKDDRILKLTEYQLEDIAYKLEEEEQQMVETNTSQIFKNDDYNNKIDEASNKVKKNIKCRMTRKRTILIGFAACLAYIFGFLPLLFTNLNTVGSFLLASVIIIIMTLLFASSGMVALLFFRYKLKKNFKAFNRTIHDICDEIETSMEQFGKYLSFSYNVMRKFSIINYGDKPSEDVIVALNKHKVDIERIIEETRSVYAGYLDNNIGLNTAEPYEYDFTVMKEYTYAPTEREFANNVDFIQCGNYVKIPVDYLNSIMVVKEDLYD